MMYPDVEKAISRAHEIGDLTAWELTIASAVLQAQRQRNKWVAQRIYFRFNQTFNRAIEKIHRAQSDLFDDRLKDHLAS